MLRFQLRLATDLAALPLNGHGHAVTQIGQVGAQVGGWLKSLRKPVPPTMKRYGNLWERVVRWDNLVLAARKARRGKRGRAVVTRFDFHQEWHLSRLQRELMDGSYRPGSFTTHWIDRPKRRLISAAPYRDRVVHHALMRSANSSRASTMNCSRRLPPDLKDACCWAFSTGSWTAPTSRRPSGSGSPATTCGRRRRRRGLPIGNLTSQWFANWYLNDLDHLVTSRLGVGGYVRYCDDFVLLDDDRGRLRERRREVVAFLASKRLRLHEGRRAVVPVRAGLRFVGYRIWKTHRLVRKANVRQFRRRVRWMRRATPKAGSAGDDILPRLASWIGHARQADSGRLLERLAGEWTFSREER